jgi:hypothetical protein
MEIALREQQIRERAYAIWEGEGRPMNRADAHWLRAEAEIAREEARPNGATAPMPKRAASAKKRDPAGEAAAPAPRRRTKP